MKIYNTLSGRKEDFQPRGKPVTMYVCGVTVYSSSHIGHAMSYIVFDTIRRHLEYRGYPVRYVQNFTDIDDKIINRANELGIPAMDLAKRYIDEFLTDSDALNIRRADIYPRATEEIPKIITVISGLIEKGYAYQSGGDVYFRVKKAVEYGKLSHQSPDQMIAGARVEGTGKEHPLDFALWKGAKPGEPSWPSPWGDGRPGWHIECSAMSLKYLGETIDIHGGGQDLVFPHHENEIAQSESFTGVAPFVRYWLHNGLLQFGTEKMSKSLGNLVTIRELLQQHTADSLRLFVLSSHYRNPLTHNEEALNAAERGMKRIRQALTAQSETGNRRVDSMTFRQKFIEAMDDDFNTPQAVAVLFDLVREINRGHEAKQDVTEAQNTLRELASVLGFSLKGKAGPSLDAVPFIELLAKTREDLRKAKQWALADQLRKELSDRGITIEDTPKGPVWKQK
ncbi:MAG: cysteine--tRNA ligase [Chloroflexota bacterium]